MNFHAITIEEVTKKLQTNKSGLNNTEVKKRQEKFGLNELTQGKKISPLKIFFAQFTDFLVIILIGAAIISFAASIMFPQQSAGNIDTVLILIILLANGVFGFIQNYKAEQSIEKLKNMSSPSAVVFRNGIQERIDASHVVPGDILILGEGDIIAADARIIEANNLRIDESNLTGESLPVTKQTQPLKEKAVIGDQSNMIFTSAFVVGGTGRAIVIATGMETQVGHIAKRLENTEDRPSPFQTELSQLGKKIGLSVIALATLIIVAQLAVTGVSLNNFLPVFIFGASLAVAAVPEGLPAVVTVGLAMGSRRMVKKKALVRHLAVVESLGSVDIICTDKTGTLTESKMSVRQIHVDNQNIEVTGQGYGLEGEIKKAQSISKKDVELLLKTGALCNNAQWQSKDEVIGDPTEIALLVSAYKGKQTKKALESYKRLHENAFSSERKMMSVVCEKKGQKSIYAKGAAEMVLEKCTHIIENEKIIKLNEAKRKEILAVTNHMASDALRVLGFAYKEKWEKEEKLIFLGLQGMIDPPRKEVAKSIKDCKKAGIRIIMITGDHPVTAAAIAKELGISTQTVTTGAELNTLSSNELKSKLKSVSVFARVNPEHKVNILQALQNEGHLVAMTGDGVNDAPALKQADVGIVMGIRGTDVARQASDMVLLDDNFATIRSAIREGRGIFDNIRKFVNYLLSANAGEVVLIVLALLYGRLILGSEQLLIPLLAVHLLWVNLLTDGLPAVALSLDPIAKNIMKRPPRPFEEGVMNRSTGMMVLTMGSLLGLTTLIMYLIHLEDPIHARTITFTTLVVLELMKIAHLRSQYKLPAFSNPWLVGAVIISFLLQLIILYTPLSQYFQLVPLDAFDWLKIGLATSVFWGLSRLIDQFSEGPKENEL